MKFDDILLALVARRSATGYDLGQWLSGVGLFVRAKADQSQIYKTLARLAESGYVDFVVEKREGAPDAKVYSPTAAGIMHLDDVASSPYAPPGRWQEPDFTIRYALFGPLAPDRVPELIETELAFRRAQIGRFRNRALTPVLDEKNSELGRDLFIDMHNLNSATLDAWLAHLERLLEEWQTRRI